MWSRALQAIKNKKNLSLLCNTENDYNLKSADINKSDNMKFNTFEVRKHIRVPVKDNIHLYNKYVGLQSTNTNSIPIDLILSLFKRF